MEITQQNPKIKTTKPSIKQGDILFDGNSANYVVTEIPPVICEENVSNHLKATEIETAATSKNPEKEEDDVVKTANKIDLAMTEANVKIPSVSPN